jgi:hypothetical protein
MKTNMEDIDKLIKDSLSQEEAKFYDQLEEQNLLQMFGGLFSGKNKWLIILMNIVQVLFFILFIRCAIMFIDATETNDLIRWGIYGFATLLAQSMLKMFSWMQMDKNGLMREIKRLELQISSLSNKLSQ